MVIVVTNDKKIEEMFLLINTTLKKYILKDTLFSVDVPSRLPSWLCGATETNLNMRGWQVPPSRQALTIFQLSPFPHYSHST